VDGIAAADFVDRQLQLLAVEFVASVSKTVGPGQERLAATAIGHAVNSVAVEDGLPAYFVVTQPASTFDHHGPLAASSDLELRS
jgi:hypothetical protein